MNVTMKILNCRRVDCQSFPGNIPYSHTVIDGLFVPDFCRTVADSFPSADAPGWVHYDNPLERKSVYNDHYGESEPIQALYDTLSDDGFLDLLEQITEIKGLAWDDSLHAAGLGMCSTGGKLDLHRDAQVHPELGWRRALTAVLFLSDWQEEWGGDLELWSERDGLPFALEKLVTPKLGRLLLFDPNGFHGYPDPIQCPPEVTRKTVQVFYWLSEGATMGRARAAFSPRPRDPFDAELEQLRLDRSRPVVSSNCH